MKTCVIYHSIDLDGWMSAAIVKHWFNKQKRNHFNSKVFKEVDVDFGTLDFIGYNYGQPIPDLSEYDKVIMCDISFPPDIMLSLYNILEDNFIWLDHHISAINNNVHVNKYAQGERAVEFAACEITWMWFFPNETTPEIVRLLGRYDCFGHKGTDEEEKVLEFQYGARNYITNYESAYRYLIRSLEQTVENTCPEDDIYKIGKHIYSFLCTEAKQTYKNGFEIELGTKYYGSIDPIDENSETQVFTKEFKFICINKERFNPINFGIDYHKDEYDGAACFHYANGMWNFSLYNDNGEVDCSAIAKQYGGGGHKGAAGFRINDINKIINNEIFSRHRI